VRIMDKTARDDILFVGITQPIEVRRNLLECSKVMVQGLQRYQRSLALRERKLEQVERLRVNLRELTILVQKLRRLLPKTDLRALKAPPKPPKSAPSEQHERPEPTELSRLEDELSEIESKLARLS